MELVFHTTSGALWILWSRLPSTYLNVVTISYLMHRGKRTHVFAVTHVSSLSQITTCTHPWREKNKRPSVGQKRLLFKLLRILAVVLVEVSADLCGESESGRHGQSDGGHFSEICTFSSEEILHVCPTVGLKTSTRLALQPKEFVKKVGIEIQKPLTWLRILDM